jgi:Xaa-Pro aminopeptidase
MKKSRSTKKPPEVLLYADSELNTDMLYFGRVSVPDAFLAFSCKGRRIAVVSQLEFARVKKESGFDEVLSMESVIEASASKKTSRFSYPVPAIVKLARKYKIRRFCVAPDFPCGLAFQLKAAGVPFDVAEGPLFPDREFKSDEEAEYIKEGNAASAAGFRVVEKLLRESEIKRGYLYHGGRRLTSERVQEAIAIACLERGAIAANTIVAGGDQACDPHCRGSGPLRANELIIVDIFPRVSKTGYHGDMTRTYLKGRASDAQKALYGTVFEAEQAALARHRSGKSASKIYKEVKRFFTDKGYPTKRENGVPVGFFHGLGHGLGLAVHEPPRVNASGDRLKKGQVITVEPGLYYPGLGGVRVEDVVRVGKSEPEMLSKHGYRWLIR